jgi:hypothetical protein
MSVSVLVYICAVAVLWPACAYAVRRVSGNSVFDRAAAGLVTAIAWPVTVPVLAFAATRRALHRPERPHLELVRDGLESLAIDAPPRAAVVSSR